MRYFLAVLRKELAVQTRRPALYIALLVVPAVLAIVASFAFVNVIGSPGRLPLLVVDLDGSAASSQLTDSLANTGDLKITRDLRVGRPFSEDDAIGGLQHGRRPAVLVIPAGYGAALASGRPMRLALYTDPAQPGPSQAVRTVLEAELDRVSLTNVGVRLAEARRPGDVGVRPAVEAGIANFLASPPIMMAATPSKAGSSLPSPWEQTVPGFAVLFSARLGSRVWYPTDDERRVYRIGSRLDSLRAPRWCHMAAKFVAAFLYGACQFAVLMTAAHFLFGMEVGSVPALAVVIGAFLLMPVSVGVAISAAFKSITAAMPFNEAWGVVVPVLGGALVPVYLLPGALSAVARFTPYYWALQAMQDVMVRGATLGDEWLNLLIMVGFAAVLLIIFLPRFSYRAMGAS